MLTSTLILGWVDYVILGALKCADVVNFVF